MIARYLSTRYEPGGRGPSVFDCWGLVRCVRAEMFNRSMLPSHGLVSPDNKRGMTHATSQIVANHLKESSCSPGVIATAWRGRLCVHVGIIVEADGRQWVLETDEATGPVLTAVSRFKTRYARVVFYD